MKSSNDIGTIFLFSSLNEKELRTIKDFSSIKTYAKGEMIFFDTEPYFGFYGILEGLVKLYKISNEGREHILHIMYPGSTFGEVPMFERYVESKTAELAYPANAMAIEDNTVVIKVPEKSFMELTNRNTDICMKMLASFAKRLRFLNSHIESVTLDDVSKRLSKYLLTETKKKNTRKDKIRKENIIELDISKYDLASHLGTITETLSRALKKLQTENIIEVNGKIIAVKDLAALKNYTK
jgi:CRP/FNR family transcriptional regulator, dissimilatory nitrate respiration regulator